MCGGKRKREFPSQVAVAQKHIRNIYLASEFPYLGKNQTQRQRERGRQGWAGGERQIESECEREREGRGEWEVGTPSWESWRKQADTYGRYLDTLDGASRR